MHLIHQRAFAPSQNSSNIDIVMPCCISIPCDAKTILYPVCPIFPLCFTCAVRNKLLIWCTTRRNCRIGFKHASIIYVDFATSGVIGIVA